MCYEKYTCVKWRHRVKVGNIAHMVSIAHCVKWVISRTLTAILPDFEFQWLVGCPSKMNSVTYFIPYPRDNSTKTYSILLIPFGFVAYFSDGRKSKNSVNFLVVSCAVVYIRACTSSNIAHHCNDEYQVVLLHQYMYDGVKQGYWMRLCFKELRIFVVYLFCPR